MNTFTQVREYLAVPEEEPEIVPPEYQEKEDLNAWLSDPKARDQYVIRWADNTEVFWNDTAAQKVEPEISRRAWTETYVWWSPRGRYLACFHRLGIILYGGPSWKKRIKFGHEGVKLIDFSPCENFLVTWSPMSEQAQVLVGRETGCAAALRLTRRPPPPAERHSLERGHRGEPARVSRPQEHWSGHALAGLPLVP